MIVFKYLNFRAKNEKRKVLKYLNFCAKNEICMVFKYWNFPSNIRLLRFSNIWIFAPKIRFSMFSSLVWNIWSYQKWQFFRLKFKIAVYEFGTFLANPQQVFPVLPWLKRKWQDNVLQCICANHLCGERLPFTAVRWFYVPWEFFGCTKCLLCLLSLLWQGLRIDNYRCAHSMLTSMPHICIRYTYPTMLLLQASKTPAMGHRIHQCIQGPELLLLKLM